MMLDSIKPHVNLLLRGLQKLKLPVTLILFCEASMKCNKCCSQFNDNWKQNFGFSNVNMDLHF